ncbi:MAG: hypothetical protein HYU64_17760 [Armatimonadetes bacterium]|nr:hypothetical protein [Armatimonadota bacterium]
MQGLGDQIANVLNDPMAQTIGVWIAAFLTLAVFSFLFKDNPFYKFAEHLFVGVSAGYLTAQTLRSNVWDEMVKKAFPKLLGIPGTPNYWTLVGGALGIILLLRLIPKVSWMSRWAIAFIIGLTAGITIHSQISSFVIAQVYDTLVPLFSGGSPAALVHNWVIFLGVLCSLVYFFFSAEHKGALGLVSRIGIWFLMVGFGAGYGFTVMTRISILLGRIYFLLGDWLHRLPKPPW